MFFSIQQLVVVLACSVMPLYEEDVVHALFLDLLSKNETPKENNYAFVCCKHRICCTI